MGDGDGCICLRDELARHKGKNVLVGVRSSFFYIGPAEEALADLPIIGLMAKFCVALASNKGLSKSLVASERGESIGDRRVVRTYARDPLHEDDDIVIIIEGREFGAFWTRAEYLAGRQALMAALDAAAHGD